MKILYLIPWPKPFEDTNIDLSEIVNTQFGYYTLTRCVDTWSDFEHDIADGDLLFGESAYIDDGFHADAGVAVQLLQTVIGENTVFAHDRDDVRRNAHRYEVEQWNQMMKFNTIVDSKCLHKLKTDSATGKVGVWISVVQAFGIQDCDGRGEDIVRHMMVAVLNRALHLPEYGHLP